MNQLQKSNRTEQMVELLTQNISIDRLNQSLVTIASLIEKGDDNLWPLFDRIELEISLIEKRKNRLCKYLKRDTAQLV